MSLAVEAFLADCLEAEDEEGFSPTEDDDVDFILASSASKAGARVLTTVSRSDCLDRLWTAGGTKMII